MSLDVVEDLEADEAGQAAPALNEPVRAPAAEALLPVLDVPLPALLPPQDKMEQEGRGGYGPETWAGLKSRLAERTEVQHAKTALVMARLRPLGFKMAEMLLPAWRLLSRLKQDGGWTLRLLWRWKRPALKAFYRARKDHFLEDATAKRDHALGAVKWYVRKFKTDAYFREDVRQKALIAGAASVVLLCVGLIWSFWPASQPYDYGVEPPPAEMVGIIEARPDSPPRVLGLGQPEGRSWFGKAEVSKPFVFEQFVSKSDEGKWVADGEAGQAELRRLFPKGSRATQFLDFMGTYYLRGQGNSSPSGDEIIAAVRQRCTGVPLGKVFRTTTITCTYTHGVQGGHRVLWIVAVSADNAERLSELSATARLIR